jgi:LysR family transcriptional regulator, glycine cleavage system transcriptional activator
MLQARRRLLPPLNALRFFEAAARHESFARAADELCVTPGAVSRQVKSLETNLGVKLFERQPQSLKITPAGKRLLVKVHDAFDLIEGGICRFHSEEDVVRISVSPNFGIRWLSSRLNEFRTRHPTTNVVIDASPELTDFAVGECDLVVRFGDGDWHGTVTDRLFPDGMTAVASPWLLSSRNPKQLSNLPLIHTESTAAWAACFDYDIFQQIGQRSSILVSHTYLAVEAALNSAGVALVHPALVARELLGGQLSLALPYVRDIGKSYWLARPSDRPPSSPAQKFMDWLSESARVECAALEQIIHSNPKHRNSMFLY